MRYQPYFSLQICHDYYQQNICTDFTIEPTQACQRLLNNHRLLAKSHQNVLQILIPLTENQEPFIPLAESIIFTFLLKLKNSIFFNITDLPADYRPNSLLIFSNESLKEQQSLALTTTLVQQQAIAKASQSPLEKRCANLSELNKLQRHEIFGLVEIHLNQSFAQDFNQNSEFRINFTAKQKIWHYYLITKKGIKSNAFSIQDMVKDRDSKVTFATVATQAEDPIVASIQSRFAESQAILLRSEKPVVCREMGRPDLQLIKDGYTKPWIPNLPNPPNHGNQVINLLDDV